MSYISRKALSGPADVLFGAPLRNTRPTTFNPVVRPVRPVPTTNIAASITSVFAPTRAPTRVLDPVLVTPAPAPTTPATTSTSCTSCATPAATTRIGSTTPFNPASSAALFKVPDSTFEADKFSDAELVMAEQKKPFPTTLVLAGVVGVGALWYFSKKRR